MRKSLQVNYTRHHQPLSSIRHKSQLVAELYSGGVATLTTFNASTADM